MKRLRNILLILTGFSFFLYFFQEKVIFFPQKWPEGFKLVQSNKGCNLERVSFSTSDGLKIDALYVSKLASDPHVASNPVILFSHGNAGNLLNRLERILAICQLPVDLLIFDYRGFGNSDGSPTVEGAVLDAEAALEFLLRKRKVPTEKIILYGESLGTGITGMLIKKIGKKCAGVVIESGFKSLKSRAGKRFPFIGPLVLKADLPTEEILKEFEGNLLVIHSKNDQVIPFEDGKSLFSICPSKKKTFFEMDSEGHNDPVWLKPDYIETWEKFLNKIEKGG